MSNSNDPITCSSCGKRRVPARRSNGRLSAKCKECFGGLFWLSSFGRWFAEATIRQSPDSMPFNEDDISGIYHLWETRKAGKGYQVSKYNQATLNWEYHISHIDPAKGDGYQGRFTSENLIVAPANSNLMASNTDPIDHGHRVYTTKKPFGTAARVKQWCGGQYDLNSLVTKLDLKKYSPPSKSSAINPEFLPKGTPPIIMLEQQLSRFEGGSTDPWKYTTGRPSEVFVTAITYGIGLGSGKLKEVAEGAPVELEDEF